MSAFDAHDGPHPVDPDHRPPSEPPGWEIVDVEDPAGGGQDYAHTVGLAARGLPEVHLWARPTDGDDPGEDWRLSHRDLASLLDDLGGLAVRGHLQPGTTLTEAMDGGLARVTFQVVPPRPAAEVGIELLPPDQAVTSLRWSLERPVPGRSSAAAGRSRWVEDRLRAVRSSTAALADGIRGAGGRTPAVPAEWRPPRARSGRQADRQPFGPLDELVLARAEQLLTSDADLLTRFVHLLLLTRAAGVGPAEVVAPLTTHARAVGRAEPVAALEARVPDLLTVLTGARGPTRRWRQAIRSASLRYCRCHQSHVARDVRVLLGQGVCCLLAAEALAETLPATLRLQATGPWLWALSGGRPPEEEWTAPPWVLRLVHDWLSGLPAEDLAEGGRRLRLAESTPGWAQAQDRLTGLVTTRAAAPSRAPVAEVEVALDTAEDRELCASVEVLLVPAVACAELLGVGAWRRITAPLRPLLPCLPTEPPGPGGAG